MLPGQCCIVMRQNQEHVMISIIAVPGDNKYCAFVEYKGCFRRLP